MRDIALPDAAFSLPRALLLALVQREPGCHCLEDDAGQLLPEALWLDEPGRSQHAFERASSALFARIALASRAYARASSESIPALLERLEAKPFHARLGSLAARARRLPAVVESLCRHGVFAAHERAAVRAAELCQLDLATEAVEEDDSLHGVFGAELFRARGEPIEVAEALVSHLRPTASEPELARDAAGALLCVADRLDTLVQSFAHGVVPTPGGDALGLRERANGMLRTMLLHGVRADLGVLVEAALRPFVPEAPWLSREDVVIRVGGFLRHRLKVLLARRFPEERVHEVLRAQTLCPASLSEQLERA